MSQLEKQVNEAWDSKNWVVFDNLLTNNPALRYNGIKWYIVEERKTNGKS